MADMNGHSTTIPVVDHRAGRDDKGYYIRTFTGKQLHWDHVNEHVFDVRDIAHALSSRVRWTGHVLRPDNKIYTIGQHCCLVHDLCPPHLHKQALFHDASEAYMPDFPSPLKWWMLARGDEAINLLEKDVDREISRQFGIPYPRDPIVKHADMIMLATENRDLMPDGQERQWMVQPLPMHIIVWDCDQAEEQFMRRYDAIIERERASATIQ
jgi:uncharacterized protein